MLGFRRTSRLGDQFGRSKGGRWLLRVTTVIQNVGEPNRPSHSCHPDRKATILYRPRYPVEQFDLSSSQINQMEERTDTLLSFSAKRSELQPSDHRLSLMSPRLPIKPKPHGTEAPLGSQKRSFWNWQHRQFVKHADCAHMSPLSLL